MRLIYLRSTVCERSGSADKTSDEKVEHTLRLAAIYKERGEVQAANAQKKGRPRKISERSDFADLFPAAPTSAPLPTTTQKLTESHGRK
jgi:hypothetical protein